MGQSFWMVAVSLVLLAGHRAMGGDVEFSDPAKVMPAPAGAVGFPSRAADLDARPGFVRPPAGYGDVGFFWWLGDPLTKERLQWQIDQLAGKGVMGLQINYAHSDAGGRTYGLTYESDPKLFSEPWWDLVGWFMKAASSKGMAVSLSDYTLGTAGQGWYIDEILAKNPGMHGAVLKSAMQAVEGGRRVTWNVPANAVSVVAYRLKGKEIEAGSGVDLRSKLKGQELSWDAPAGKWQIVAVAYVVGELSMDPMNPLAGQKVIETFFQRFEDRNPGEAGKGLNFFFSDELQFGVAGNLWNGRFAEEFKKRKGYDLLGELPALFVDIGPRTPKVRLDYSDVMVSLQEEGYFKPIFEWHQKRGMIYGCDHGGRGSNPVEFGDYFRTQRWNQGPGNDQPHLGAGICKDKVHSSIAHLYQRPRTWLEGYYGSGWGTTTAQVAEATFKNFAIGSNLLTLHGLYYSTHGGYWEWAPPCNHYHMPYWAHMKTFLDCAQRLSYLLSQGIHRCDVAIVYPVAPMEAKTGGSESMKASFDAGTQLYERGIDFDFMDFQSLERAKVEGKRLSVSGENYRVLVLPAMPVVRHSTVVKAVEFFRAGGIVIAIGDLPAASERVGRGDAELDAMVKEMFGVSAAEAKAVDGPVVTKSAAGGMGVRVRDSQQVGDFIAGAFARDFAVLGDAKAKPYMQHRKVGARDVYFIYGIGAGTECAFRATGAVELWDPWTGASAPLAVISQTGAETRLALPLSEDEPQVIVFSPGEATVAAVKPAAAVVADVEGDWDFELKPTLDNRWGDFRWPATNELLGAEVRQIRYAEETSGGGDWSGAGVDDSKWGKVTQSFGPRMWKLGPLPEKGDVSALEAELAKLEAIDPSRPVEVGGKKYKWSPYAFSWRWGLEGDPGHEGYHGLKNQVTDEFIALGKVGAVKHSSVYTKEEGGSRYYLWTTVVAGGDVEARTVLGGVKPAAAWVNHAKLTALPSAVKLKAGANPLLIRYDQAGRSYFVVGTEEAATAQALPIGALKMRWLNNGGVMQYDLRPEVKKPAGWYRFTSPPGLKGMTMVVAGRPQVWVDGKAVGLGEGAKAEGGAMRYEVNVANPTAAPVKVAIRVEMERGCYGGAAFVEPIGLKCGAGTFAVGDWSQNDGLLAYSGGAWYRKTVALSAEQAGGRVVLDLGNVVSSAEVLVNGQPAGVRVAPPWKLDITKLVKAGENRVEVLVYSTLGNHYTTIPSKYKGSPVAGLLGPVKIETTGK